jgi:hypothetical protein
MDGVDVAPTAPHSLSFSLFSLSTTLSNGLQYSFQVWQGFINVSEFFSYKDSLLVLATTRKEDFRINSTFRSDFLVYLKLLNCDKSDSSIFRILIFRFLLSLLFSSQSLGYYYLFGSIVSWPHISPPKGGRLGFN